VTQSKQKILVVEDETAIAEIVIEYLQREGYEAVAQTSGDRVQAMLIQQNFDLILLDVMLPGMNGFDLCREIRKTSMIPIIMMTARVEEIDRLIGLELGADDYICKPFSPREVVARTKAVLRRHEFAKKNQDKTSEHQEFELDQAAFLLKIRGQKVDLTPSEFKLLSALAARPNNVMSRSQLLDVLSDEKDVYDRTIDSHIKNLRKKISKYLPERDIVQTIYGIGYRFDPS
jgi:two-component system response regulator BaeR